LIISSSSTLFVPQMSNSSQFQARPTSVGQTDATQIVVPQLNKDAEFLQHLESVTQPTPKKDQQVAPHHGDTAASELEAFVQQQNESSPPKKLYGFSQWKYKHNDSLKEEEKRQKKLESNALKKVKERQRRSKMSQSIQQLRNLVPLCQQEKKLNQSLVMSRTVEYIKFLQQKVIQLEQQFGCPPSITPMVDNDDSEENEQFESAPKSPKSPRVKPQAATEVPQLSEEQQKIINQQRIEQQKREHFLQHQQQLEQQQDQLKQQEQQIEKKKKEIEEHQRQLEQSRYQQEQQHMQIQQQQKLLEEQKQRLEKQIEQSTYQQQPHRVVSPPHSFSDISDNRQVNEIFMSDIEEVGAWPLYFQQEEQNQPQSLLLESKETAKKPCALHACNCEHTEFFSFDLVQQNIN